MAEQPAEEKSLPATERKLEEGRKKGQVPQSRDLRIGATTAAIIGYLIMSWQSIRDQITELVDIIAAASTSPFAEVWQRCLTITQDLLIDTTLPLVLIACTAVILSGVAGTFGPVFAFETIKPNFEHINPVTGFKRIFSIKNLVEFLKSVVKVIALIVTLWLVVRTFIEPLFQAPICGDTCLAPVFLMVLKALAIAGALAFLVIGALDLLMQRRLFLHDMRMTKTELKRERKDLDGDPFIRRERRRLQNEMADAPRLGIAHASLIISLGGERMVGIRFNRRDAPVPSIVCRGTGERGAALLAEARRLGLPIEVDAALITALERQAPGDRINRAHYEPVAALLVRHGLT